ncbi:MAG: ATP-dependent DNA helicase [Candidatus Paceibacterota bacterium]
MNDVFEKRYKTLNPAQRQAVDTLEGPVMALAGPGTGKTSILVLRIANILKTTDTPASAILAITYTEAGVSAIRKKLHEIIGERANEVCIHTFHSFALSLISEYRDHFPTISGFEQLSDIDAEKIILSILRDKKFDTLRPLGREDMYVYDILKGISNVKKEAIAPSEVKKFALEQIKITETSEESISTRGKSKGQLKADAKKYIEKCNKSILFSDVYSEYERIKKESELIDYDDLILEVLSAFSKDELFLQLAQEKFFYIHIDEHQDTNDSQNLLLESMLTFFETPNVFIVGDEKQAIYRFQGASVKNFLHFSKKYPHMHTISLTENYRSNQTILNTSHSIILNNYDDTSSIIPEHLQGQKTSEHAVTLLEGDTDTDILFSMAGKVKETSEKETIAVIVRKNSEVDFVTNFMREQGISASAERSVDVLSHPLSVLVFELCRVVIDPSDFEALGKTVAKGLWGLSFEQKVEVLQKIKSGDLSAVFERIPAIKAIVNQKTSMGIASFLVFMAEQSMLRNKIVQTPLSAEIWRNITILSEHVASSLKTEDAESVLEQVLLYSKSKKIKNIFFSSGNANARVRVMTAHSSKGLEFDSVYVPFCTEESWIGKRSHPEYFVLPIPSHSQEKVKDERRLFYVALTRAKNTLTLGTFNKKIDGVNVTPLRFLDEITEENGFSRTTVSHTSEYGLESTGMSLTDKQTTEATDYTKHLILKKGISVTSLNHFMECPSKFYIESILRLPHAPSATAEKGNAMHDALSQIWNSKNFSIDAMKELYENRIKLFFSRSLLPVIDKNRIEAELLEQSDTVLASLEQHFVQKGEVLSESWVSRTYDFKKEAITLHGKLDVIFETENEILVYDYKTKKAMSENEILGETKSSDGSYWRQLVFYTLLLKQKSETTEKAVIPFLVFVIPNDKGECKFFSKNVTEEDKKKVLLEIDTMLEQIWNGEFLKTNCDKKDCEWCALKQESFT